MGANIGHLFHAVMRSIQSGFTQEHVDAFAERLVQLEEQVAQLLEHATTSGAQLVDRDVVPVVQEVTDLFEGPATKTKH